MYAAYMNNSHDILINNLKKEMKIRGWSQSMLGDEADVTQERISNLLNGKTEPTLLLVDKIANALGITTVELLSDNEVSLVVSETPPPYNRNKNNNAFTKYGKNSKVANISIEIPNLSKFREDFMVFNYDAKSPDSGKPNSYSNYMEYLFQNYYDNFGEILDPIDIKSADKLERLCDLPGYTEYNSDESRFPNASLNAYKRFVLTL